MDLKCPTCKAAVAPRKENDAFPFCTTRCQEIDLGKWFNAEYVIPAPITEFDLPFPAPGEDED